MKNIKKIIVLSVLGIIAYAPLTGMHYTPAELYKIKMTRNHIKNLEKELAKYRTILRTLERVQVRLTPKYLPSGTGFIPGIQPPVMRGKKVRKVKPPKMIGRDGKEIK